MPNFEKSFTPHENFIAPSKGQQAFAVEFAKTNAPWSNNLSEDKG